MSRQAGARSHRRRAGAGSRFRRFVRLAAGAALQVTAVPWAPHFQRAGVLLDRAGEILLSSIAAIVLTSGFTRLVLDARHHEKIF